MAAEYGDKYGVRDSQLVVPEHKLDLHIVKNWVDSQPKNSDYSLPFIALDLLSPPGWTPLNFTDVLFVCLSLV